MNSSECGPRKAIADTIVAAIEGAEKLCRNSTKQHIY